MVEMVKDRNGNEKIMLIKEIMYELTNIGSAHSATAISKFIGKRVDISVPNVSFERFDSVIDRKKFPGMDDEHLSIKFYYGERSEGKGNNMGIILVTLTESNMCSLYGAITGDQVESVKLDDETKSLFSEIGNIMVGSYMSSISNFLGTSLSITPPLLFQSRLSDALKGSVIEVTNTDGYLFLLSSDLIVEDKSLTINTVMFFDTKVIKAIENMY